MGFIVVNTAAGSPQPDVEIVDLGLTIPGGGSLDLITEYPNDVAMSADLVAKITGGDLIVLDPLDDTTPLTIAQSIEMVEVHNDPHYRIRGGELTQLDDVTYAGSPIPATPNTDDLLQWNGTTWINVDPSTVAGDMLLGDLGDVTAPASSPNYASGESYILVGDGSGGVTVTQISGTGGSPYVGGPLCEPVEDIVGEMIGNRSVHSDITVTYTDGGGTCDGTLVFSVDDVFLHNTGPETFGPGTLTFDSGDLIIGGPSGSPSVNGSITIEQDAPATIETPTGGFTNNNDIVNKEYVDSIASGLDPKESVRVATEPGDTGGTYTAASPCGPGDTITGFPGVLDTVTLAVNDRVLVKDRTDAKENGIYSVSVVNATSPLTVDLVRADDQDGTPANEVSSGNFTHVEQGSQNINTKWMVTGDGILTLCTDDINWVLFSGPDTLLADVGLTRVANTISLDVGDLTVGTPVLTDTIAFHDPNGTSQGVAGSQTYSTSFDDFFMEFNVAYNISGQGIIVRSGGSPDSYVARTIVASALADRAGIEVLDGDGISGNPTVGLDIEGLPAPSGSTLMDVLDRVPVYDISADENVYYTIGEIATALASTDSFKFWAGTGNVSGDSPALITAATATDTATLEGGVGINLDFDSGTQTVKWDLDFSAIPDSSPTVVEGGTEIIINNGGTINTTTLNDLFSTILDGGNGISITGVGSPEQLTVALDICGVTPGSTATLDSSDTIAVCDSGSTVAFSLEEILDTLGVPSGVTGTGLVVKLPGSPESYTTRDIVESTNAGEEGAQVNVGDGATGDIEIGVDIDNLGNSPDDMATTDEFIVYDGTNNVSMTGQQIIDGVEANSDIKVEVINGQPIVTYTDNTRGTGSPLAKRLSTDMVQYSWEENTVGNNDWVRLGGATDALTGHVMPMDATIVGVVAHTSNDGGNSKGIRLYIDGTLYSTPDPLFSFTAVSGQNEYNSFVTMNLDVDVDQGEKIRLRGDASGGVIQDTVITLYIRWRS